MILWRNIEFFTFYHFDPDPRFPPFLLYVWWKSGVTFVRKCFRDGKGNNLMLLLNGQNETAKGIWIFDLLSTVAI